MNIKKYFFITLSFIMVFGLLTFFLESVTVVRAQRQAPIPLYQLTGWGWSSNIGWISLSSANAGAGGGSYGVTLSEGQIGGYAWSSNIGWIKFSGDGSHPGPAVDLTTGDVTGWIRACSGTVTNDCAGASRTDGWDGWIHLSDPVGHPTRHNDGTKGITFNPTTGIFNGYAWGSDVVGWLTFGTQYSNPNDSVHCTPGVDCPGGDPGPSVNLTATPSSIQQGGNASLSWTSNDVTSCTSNGDWNNNGTRATSGNESTGVLNTVKTYTYTLNCTGPNGSASDTATVDVGAAVGSGIDMWLTTGTNHLSNLTIKKGQNALIKWLPNSGTAYTSCVGRLPPIVNTIDLGDGVVTSSYLVVNPPIGAYTFYMSCAKASDGSIIDALNPSGQPSLKIIVKDSSIEEI